MSPGTAVSATATERRVTVASLAVYGAMTLLGIIEAATLKNVADNAAALIIVIVSGSVSIVIAHAWAHVIAHRLIRGHESTRDHIVEELWFAAAFLIPAAVAIVAIVVTLGMDDFEATVGITQIVLLAFLFVIGTAGARRASASWPRAVAWGVLDVGVGIGIVALKELLSLIYYT